MRKADDLTTFLCRCHCYLGTLTFWNSLGHSRSVTGLLYLYLYTYDMYMRAPQSLII